MPSTLEKRIDRVEAAIGGVDESRILYCATDRDAERLWSEASASGKRPPMCFVTGETTGPAVSAGETIDEVLARVAVHGRRIHDPQVVRSTSKETGLSYWHPPRMMQGRH